ncbi:MULTISPECIES: dTDP-glucose 4,6-dehydratase [unclassified Akkermansia]|uniref:dTDP-glucose 4,6-dehydratase n=1 Tax=unclassified Akkermansia TaxID=2608915 RepID=UPI0031B8AADA
MRVIVTGGAGFIGSNLVRLLLERGCEVLNIDALTYAGNIHSLDDVADLPAYRFLHADVRDAELMRRTMKEYSPDWVMHLAAESHVDRSIDDPGDFITTNVMGTFSMLQSALDCYRSLEGERKQRFRFHYISTDEVYGTLGRDGLFTEATPYSPHSPYSASKAASDHLVRAWHDTYGLPVLVTNCSNNYGPYQFPEKLIPVVILKALAGEPIPVYGKGENVRDWLYVLDHCEALFTVVSSGKPGETYNIGGNNEKTNLELVELLCSHLDELRPRADGGSYRDQITFVRDRPGHDLRYAIDASKIRRELGWEPKQDHSSGFRKTIEWYLTHEEWWRRILSGDYRLERLGING